MRRAADISSDFINLTSAPAEVADVIPIAVAGASVIAMMQHSFAARYAEREVVSFINSSLKGEAQ